MSFPLLLKRAKSERDPTARKNVYRALGACGGVAGDRKAAQRLLKGMKDRDRIVAKHAVLAMAHYSDDAVTAGIARTILGHRYGGNRIAAADPGPFF